MTLNFVCLIWTESNGLFSIVYELCWVFILPRVSVCFRTLEVSGCNHLTDNGFQSLTRVSEAVGKTALRGMLLLVSLTCLGPLVWDLGFIVSLICIAPSGVGFWIHCVHDLHSPKWCGIWDFTVSVTCVAPSGVGFGISLCLLPV